MILTWLKIVFDSKEWISEEQLYIMISNLEMLFQKVDYKLQSLRRDKSKTRIQVSADLIYVSGWLITSGKYWSEETDIHFLA